MNCGYWLNTPCTHPQEEADAIRAGAGRTSLRLLDLGVREKGEGAW